MGAEQPCGVAQQAEDAVLHQVVGHVGVHRSQRVIEQVELLLLGGGGTLGIKAEAKSPSRKTVLSCPGHGWFGHTTPIVLMSYSCSQESLLGSNHMGCWGFIPRSACTLSTLPSVLSLQLM